MFEIFKVKSFDQRLYSCITLLYVYSNSHREILYHIMFIFFKPLRVNVSLRVMAWYTTKTVYSISPKTTVDKMTDKIDANVITGRNSLRSLLFHRFFAHNIRTNIHCHKLIGYARAIDLSIQSDKQGIINAAKTQ